MVDGLCPLQRSIIIIVLAWQEAGSGDETGIFGRLVQCGGFRVVALETLY